MRMQTVKKASDINLHGVTPEVEIVDGSIVAVTLRDGKGGLFRVVKLLSIDEVEVEIADE